jgi:hypothetical protein
MPRKRTDLGKDSPRLTFNDFADLGIQGLSTRDAVRHYWNAWERSELGKSTQLISLDHKGRQGADYGEKTIWQAPKT